MTISGSRPWMAAHLVQTRALAGVDELLNARAGVDAAMVAALGADE